MLLRKSAVTAFTIVEVLIALGIVVFGVLAAYEQFVATHRQGLHGLDRIQARYLAHQELEQLRACPYIKLKTFAMPEKKTYPDYLKFFYQDQVTTRPDGLLELSVTVGCDMTGMQNFEPGHSITVKGFKAP